MSPSRVSARLVLAVSITTSITTGLVLAGCTAAGREESGALAPAKVESVTGSQFQQVTLTKQAAARLGVQTTPIEPAQVELRNPGAGPGSTVPYSAVLYGTDGTTWVFIEMEPLTFMRQEITVDHVTADTAILSAGPVLGTDVVTIGAAELYGTELGIGH